MSIKVLIAAGIYPPDPGGPALHAFKQYKWLEENGHQVEVVALAHYRVWPAGVRHLFYFINLISKAWKHQVIFAHDALGVGLPAMLVSKLLFKKFALRIGGDIPWEREAERGQKISMLSWYSQGLYKSNTNFKVSRFVLRQADSINVTSEILKGIYTRYYGIPESRIRTLPNPWPEARGTSAQPEGTIVFASRLVAYKNLDLVIRVLKNIFVTHPDLKFVIMGDGPEKGSLIDLSLSLGIKDNVIFTGTVSQEVVTENISKCLFAIAPALTEFNPNYILQAVGLGKPFIISREHGLPLQVPPELTFDPISADDLERAIVSLLEPKTYQEALEKVAKLGPKIGWEDYQAESLKLIQSLV